MSTSIKTALHRAILELEKTTSSPRLDAEILLSEILKKNRSFLYAYPEKILSQSELDTFQQWIEKRLAGMPVAYLIGYKEFWSLTLKVNEHTLIPRPETELLVELSLNLIEKKRAKILDLGTGSGAIALACATEKPFWEITACDINLNALKIAAENASNLGLNQIQFCHSNWFENLDKTAEFDAILSNPPYISSSCSLKLEKDLDYEPSIALFSGDDGLDAIELIISEGLARLKPGGLLLIEHGFDQKPAVQSMLIKYGYGSVQTWVDSNGLDRVSAGRK